LENQVQEILDTKFKKESDSRLTSKSADFDDYDDCYSSEPYYIVFEGNYDWDQQLDLIIAIEEEYDIFFYDIYFLGCCSNKAILEVYDCGLLQKLINTAANGGFETDDDFPTPGTIGVFDVEGLEDEDVVEPGIPTVTLDNNSNLRTSITFNFRGQFEYFSFSLREISAKVYENYDGGFTANLCINDDH